MNKNFDPYFDWDKLNDEMVQDVHKDLLRYKQAQKKLMFDPDKQGVQEFIEAHMELATTVEAIQETIHTQPVMVHVAGERKMETNPANDSQEGLLQRCSRCGSVLHFWHEGIMALTPDGPRELGEDDVPWWEPGTIVAKATTPNGMGMYEIDSSRTLESHEMECVSLAELSSDG